MENIVSSIIPAPNVCEEEKKRQKKAQINQKQRERRANLSDEKRALIRAKNASQHRNKYQEEKAFLKRHLDDNNNKLKSNRNNIQCGDDKKGEDDANREDDEDEDEDEDGEGENEDQQAAADRVNALLLSRQKNIERNRNYKKARYDQLKHAQEKLKEISNNEDDVNEHNIQQLQLLAGKRRQNLEYGRQYTQTYRQNRLHQHRRWVPIQQLWDEDNPCR